MLKMTARPFVPIQVMRIWKYRGKTFEEVSKIDPWYLSWIIWADFTEDIKYTCKVWLWEVENELYFDKKDMY
jgi:hypothetical protein